MEGWGSRAENPVPVSRTTSSSLAAKNGFRAGLAHSQGSLCKSVMTVCKRELNWTLSWVTSASLFGRG